MLEGSSHGLILTYHPDICLKGLTESTENLGRDSRSLGPDFNPGTPKYKAGVRRSVPSSFACHCLFWGQPLDDLCRQGIQEEV